MHKKIGGMKVRDTDAADQYEPEHPVAATHPRPAARAVCQPQPHHPLQGHERGRGAARIEWLQAAPDAPEYLHACGGHPARLTIAGHAVRSTTRSPDYHGSAAACGRAQRFGAQTPR